ncbi:MAG: carbon-nitrogen hydrolase family protein [Clostridia bacterium]|nr:carbon-nitrogen hydrolase family protein [Clostridia bacterium]
MNVRIAFLQLLPGNSTAQQLELGRKACEEAKAKGADIALFPEMWSSGYRIPQDRQALKKLAVAGDSPFVRSFALLAAELRMAIAVTYLEDGEPAPLNSVTVFDRRGQMALHYSKVHTCAFEDEKMLSPGGGFFTAGLDLEGGTLQIGAMICFDREFPESARVLMLKGAELILAPNACPMEINRLSALRTRAYENMLAVATCNYPEGQPDCNGRSTLFDGVPWLKEGPGVRDMCVFEAPGKAGVYIADLDLDRLRRHRETDVMGSRYRHPEAYRCLSHISKNRNDE